MTLTPEQQRHALYTHPDVKRPSDYPNIEQQRLTRLRASALRLDRRELMSDNQQALLDGIQRLVQRHQEGTVHEGSLYRRIVALHFLHSKRYHR